MLGDIITNIIESCMDAEDSDVRSSKRKDCLLILLGNTIPCSKTFRSVICY